MPKGPGAALSRAGAVNLAFAGLAVEKHAVPVVELDKALANAHGSYVLQLKFLDRHSDELRQGFDFFLVDPDVTCCACATIAALRALETKAILVPGLFLVFLVAHFSPSKFS